MYYVIEYLKACMGLTILFWIINWICGFEYDQGVVDSIWGSDDDDDWFW